MQHVNCADDRYFRGQKEEDDRRANKKRGHELLLQFAELYVRSKRRRPQGEEEGPNGGKAAICGMQEKELKGDQSIVGAID